MEDPWDAPLSWEEFFGGSSATDLVPTLLHMYDTLACGAQPTQRVPPPNTRPPDPPPPVPGATRLSNSPARMCGSPKLNNSASARVSDHSSRLGSPRLALGKPPRPLSAASTCSSSSSSGEAGAATAAAYLASTESLEACTSEEEEDESLRHVAARRRGRLGQALREGSALLNRQSGSSAGSADSGVGGCSHISAPHPPPARPRYCDPHLSYMDRVVMEIVETEAVYVRDLREVVEGYLHEWRESSECPIEPQHLADLFSNMEAILSFNSGFLRELESCGLDPVSVAECFVKSTSGFRIYTEYCTSYPRTVGVLTQLMRREETVKLCRERQAALHHSLPLGSFLLKPVQRILKYHLLLQNIVKQFEGDAEARGVIETALSAMTSLAQHINEMKRRHEHAVRVQEIQSLLHDWQGADLTTFGELCAEGTFRVCGAKALRHAFLFDKMLLIAKRSGDALSCKTHIECSNLMLIESIPGEPLSFHVIPFDNPRMQYTFQARSLEQKREWSQQLKKVILENYSAVIPSHARQLVMQLGQGRSEDELLAERATPRRQHSAPEYLQRRQQERRRSETGLLPSRLRRARRSDSGLPGREGSSPTLPRRGQRSLSASREAAETEQEEQQAPPAASTLTASTEKLKDRFYNWHRKSEPYCSLTLPSKLSQLFSSSDRRASVSPAPEEPPKPEVPSEKIVPEPEPVAPAPTPELQPRRQSMEDQQARRQASLEEIVGELVLQNVGLQRALRRSRSLSRPRDSTADSSSDCEHRSPRQRLRAQRLARMCALRQQQENLQRLEQWGKCEDKPSDLNDTLEENQNVSFLEKWKLENDIKCLEDEDCTDWQMEDVPKAVINLTNDNIKEEIVTPEVSPEVLHRPGSLLGVLASLGSRLRVNSTETLAEAEPQSPRHVAAMYKQGSPSLGARIAQSCSEYADPQTLMRRPEQDSSFYEKSLAAALDEEEAFRDSAIFSDDHDEMLDPPRPVKIPPPVPAKPKATSSAWKSPTCITKFNHHSKVTENVHLNVPKSRTCTRNSNSADNLLNVQAVPNGMKSSSSSNDGPWSHQAEDTAESQAKPRGWVKHIVGKLQATPDS